MTPLSSFTDIVSYFGPVKFHPDLSQVKIIVSNQSCPFLFFCDKIFARGFYEIDDRIFVRLLLLSVFVFRSLV